MFEISEDAVDVKSACTSKMGEAGQVWPSAGSFAGSFADHSMLESYDKSCPLLWEYLDAGLWVENETLQPGMGETRE